MLVRVRDSSWNSGSLFPNSSSDTSVDFSLSSLNDSSTVIWNLGWKYSLVADQVVFNFSSLTSSTLTGFSAKTSETNFRNFWQSSNVDMYPKEMRTDPVGRPATRSMLSPHTWPACGKRDVSMFYFTDPKPKRLLTCLSSLRVVSPAGFSSSVDWWFGGRTDRLQCCRSSQCEREYCTNLPFCPPEHKREEFDYSCTSYA